MIAILLVFWSAHLSWAGQIRAIVFDCDGVLVDSEGQKFEAWREVLAHEGIELTRAAYLDVVGLDNGAMLKRFAADHHRVLGETLIAEKERVYHARQRQGLVLIRPAVEFARYLSAHRRELGIKLGLASSAARAEIEENLRQAGLASAFDEVASGVDDLAAIHDPAGTNKPAPYIYREIARRLKVPLGDILVFEDSAAGVQAAVRAGSPVLAVPNAYTKQQSFAGAVRVTDLNAVPAVLMKRFFTAKTPPLRLVD